MPVQGAQPVCSSKPMSGEKRTPRTSIMSVPGRTGQALPYGVGDGDAGGVVVGGARAGRSPAGSPGRCGSGRPASRTGRPRRPCGSRGSSGRCRTGREPCASATSVSFLLMRALASKTASRPTMAMSSSSVTTIISTSVKPRGGAGGADARSRSSCQFTLLTGSGFFRNPVTRAVRAPMPRPVPPLVGRDGHVDALELVGHARPDVGEREGRRPSAPALRVVRDLVRPRQRVDDRRRKSARRRIRQKRRQVVRCGSRPSAADR